MAEIKRALSWVAWEQAGFAVKLAQQIDAMQDGFPEAAKLDGAFPEYGPKGRRIRKDKGKKKRGMSAYNLFLRETILHLKTTQAHEFKDAVAMWKDVSPRARTSTRHASRTCSGTPLGRRSKARSPRSARGAGAEMRGGLSVH